MDLVVALKKKIDAIPEGDHVAGLRAVLRHVEVAFSHLQRGQDIPDDAAFTDAIYRSNQAFEGGIKEAYRVLAAKPPEQVTPYNIENYLEQNSIFRPRVLALFTNYRKEWRNPSTHDYKLDFDEGEALLACVSVTAFACLVSDQIIETLAFRRSNQTTIRRRRRRITAVIGKDGVVETLGQRLARALQQYGQSQPAPDATPVTESQLVGSISGHLNAIAPKDSVSMDAQLVDGRRERADLLVKTDNEVVVIEIKNVRSIASGSSAAMAQVEHYMTLSDATSAILYIAGAQPEDYEVVSHEVPNSTKRIYIVGPKQAA
jgi:hypothetical protein